MNIKLRKPILIGGIGISLALWLWQSLLHSVINFSELSLAGVMFVGMGFWWLQRKNSKDSPKQETSISITQETVDKAIASCQTTIETLATEAPDRDVSQLKAEISNLPLTGDRQELQIAITGGNTKIGKTSLKEILLSKNINDKINFVETEALCSQSEDKAKSALELSLAADLALFIATGDLTESELEIVQQLKDSSQRLLVIFNKQDRYAPEERAFILQQLRQRVAELAPQKDVLAISANPAKIKVRKHHKDGAIVETMEKPAAEVDTLCDRLEEIVTAEKELLTLATTYREAIGLKTKAKNILNEVRSDRATPIIEQYQWIAAAAAFANPVAALDLLATVAISAQMLVDLSEIYQQKFSLEKAKIASGTIGELMVKLGLVEFSTQTVGSMLKTNAITYLAGGAVQSISAAYLTRIAGLSLIEYFQELEINAETGQTLNMEVLQAKIKQIFQQNQRIAIVQSLAEKAIARLPQLKNSTSAEAAGA